MAASRQVVQSVALEGEIVELLLEDAGRRRAKIVLSAPVLVDISDGCMPDPHLGDRVLVRAWIGGVGVSKEDV